MIRRKRNYKKYFIIEKYGKTNYSICTKKKLQLTTNDNNTCKNTRKWLLMYMAPYILKMGSIFIIDISYFIF